MVKAYLDFHKNMWSDNTSRNAAYTLSRYYHADPQRAFSAMEGLKPYSRHTAWTRLCHFAAWSGNQAYVDFTHRHKKLLKNSYTPEKLTLTFPEALERINKIAHLGLRTEALRLLLGAQRWSDAPSGAGVVTGKGGRTRPDFSPHPKNPDISYMQLYRALKKEGLKPHTLRKLALTRLVEKGATAADLMVVAGWSSIATAYSYLQSKQVTELKGILNDRT